MLTSAGRRARTTGAAVGLALLVAGTFVGADDDFPFGPFRMYATRDDPNGLVVAARVVAVDSTGRTLTVPSAATGMRRAEIEGMAGRFRANPQLLAALSAAHDRLRPHEPPYREVLVVQTQYRLHDSRPTGAETETVVARWQR